MTATVRLIASVGSAGGWVSSSGDLSAALQSLDGEYAVSGSASSNMFMLVDNFGATIGGDTINSVTIRIRARTSAVGQPTGQLTVGHRQAGTTSTIMYNENPGSTYSQVANDGAWAWYEFPYLINPYTELPWQASDLPGGDWDRLYVRFYQNGGAPIHVDQVEIVVDHTAGAVSAIDGVGAVYSGSTSVGRVYSGEDIIWDKAP